MNFKRFIFSSVLFLAATAAHAGVVSLNPTADGSVRTWGGNEVKTADAGINFTQSGGLQRHAIFEFDLSAIDDAATINSVSFDLTITRFVSNTGSNPAAIHIFAYNGDGVVDISDYAATATEVANTSTPQGGSAGDVRSFSLSDVAPI